LCSKTFNYNMENEMIENTLNLNQSAQLIGEVGNLVTTVLVGEPGVGKTTILKSLAAQYPTHVPIYIDAPVTDIPELGMPAVRNINGEERTVSALHEQWVLDRPAIYMIDEIGKMVGPTKLVMTRFMLERNMLGHDIHPDSIVFGTSNLATDGVGDSFPAHMNNRVTKVQISKPSADEWIHWGSEHGIDPMVLAWVDQTPHALNSYLDASEKENPYIFNPKVNTGAFVSPRSLEKASHIIKRRHALGNEVTRIALMGTVGKSAAGDMQAFFGLADALERYETVEKNPDTAKIPSNVAARLMMVFGLNARVDAKTIEAHLTYMKRMPEEMQAIWGRSLVRSSKAGVAMSVRAFAQWAASIGALL
jgi:energy-coupling factor transporter ATP-binding protein EcfA2